MQLLQLHKRGDSMVTYMVNLGINYCKYSFFTKVTYKTIAVTQEKLHNVVTYQKWKTVG